MTPAHLVVGQIDVVESYQAFRPYISVGQNQGQADIAKLAPGVIKQHSWPTSRTAECGASCGRAAFAPGRSPERKIA